MINLTIFLGHPIPPSLFVIGLLLALLFTAVMAWLFTQDFAPELKKEVARPAEKRQLSTNKKMTNEPA